MDNIQNLLKAIGGGRGAPAPQSNALVEFKAGKMSYDGKKVKPERRKGIIRVTKDMQGMIQFSFLDAETKNKIDSLYVFPGDAKFEKVKQTKDRVYLLEFSSTKQRFFYWMQEEEKENDAENCRKVHCHINGIPLDQPASS